MEDALKDLLVKSGFTPVEQEEGTSDFPNLKGGYKARIAGLKRVIGDGDYGAYDFESLNLQVVETIKGDKGDNRYLGKKYKFINEYSEDTSLDVRKRLLNDLWSAGVKVTLSDDCKGLPTEEEKMEAAINEIRDQIVDQLVDVSAWEMKDKKDDSIKYQIIKLVKEIKRPSEETEATPAF